MGGIISGVGYCVGESVVGAGVGDVVGAVYSNCIQGGIGLPLEGGSGRAGNMMFAAAAKLRKLVAKSSSISSVGGSFNF